MKRQLIRITLKKKIPTNYVQENVEFLGYIMHKSIFNFAAKQFTHNIQLSISKVKHLNLYPIHHPKLHHCSGSASALLVDLLSKS